MLKKTKKQIRFSFFWSKKRKIRHRLHIFLQKSPNIQNFITKTVKKAPHPQKLASWCQNLSENSKSKPFYILTIWWWHKTPHSRVFLLRNSPTQPMGPLCKPLKNLILKGTCEKLSLDATAFSSFQTQLSQFIDLNRNSGQQALTKLLTELDYRRDQLLSYFFAKINLEISSPKEATRKAAESLLLFRKQYFGIQSKPQREESFLINGLLLDSEKAEYKPAITTLGLKETLEELKKLNTDFEAQLSQRAEAEITANSLPAKQLREQLDAFYAQSSRRVDAFNLLTPNAESAAFIASLNKLIKDTNEAWKLHKAQLGRWTEEGGREEEEESHKTPTE